MLQGSGQMTGHSEVNPDPVPKTLKGPGSQVVGSAKAHQSCGAFRNHGFKVVLNSRLDSGVTKQAQALFLCFAFIARSSSFRVASRFLASCSRIPFSVCEAFGSQDLK